MDSPDQHLDYKELAQRINDWSKSLGFQQLGITDTLMDAHEARLMDWLNDGYHGEMDYMAKHGTKRSRPAELVDGTLRVISVRMDYFPPDAASIETVTWLYLTLCTGTRLSQADAQASAAAGR